MKEKKRVAVYPGTFDPVTKGHVDVIKAAAKLFDTVYIALLRNPKKTPMFNIDTRSDMIARVISRLGLRDQVHVRMSDKLTVEFAREVEAFFIVRGLRLTTDYEAELNIALNNRILDSNILTVLIPPTQENVHVSSTVVRELIEFGNFDDLWMYLDFTITDYLKQHFKDRFK